LIIIVISPLNSILVNLVNISLSFYLFAYHIQTYFNNNKTLYIYIYVDNLRFQQDIAPYKANQEQQQVAKEGKAAIQSLHSSEASSPTSSISSGSLQTSPFAQSAPPQTQFNNDEDDEQYIQQASSPVQTSSTKVIKTPSRVIYTTPVASSPFKAIASGKVAEHVTSPLRKNKQSVLAGNGDSENVDNALPQSPSRFQDAFDYIGKIRTHFASRPHIYEEFLETMRVFRLKQLEIEDVIVKVQNLFHNDVELLNGFDTFLPPGYTAYQENIQTHTTQVEPQSEFEAEPAAMTSSDLINDTVGIDEGSETSALNTNTNRATKYRSGYYQSPRKFEEKWNNAMQPVDISNPYGEAAQDDDDNQSGNSVASDVSGRDLNDLNTGLEPLDVNLEVVGKKYGTPSPKAARYNNERFGQSDEEENEVKPNLIYNIYI